MSLVSAVVTDVRVEINDSSSTRFSDDTTVILPLIKQAIRRANRICQRASLHFAKKKTALTCTEDQAYVTAPVDLDIPIGIWRDSTHEIVTQLTEQDWETVVSAQECEYWLNDVENSKILLNGTPSSAVALTMWYFPTVDPSAYTTSSTMPWGGKLDDIIARYVSLRIQNIDEINVQVDENLLAEMEQSIVGTYQLQAPQRVETTGWLS
jgi:hypothetical protein